MRDVQSCTPAALLSKVYCDACRIPMAITQAESLPDSSRLVSITYRCLRCGTEVARLKRCEPDPG